MPLLKLFYDYKFILLRDVEKFPKYCDKVFLQFIRLKKKLESMHRLPSHESMYNFSPISNNGKKPLRV